MKQTFIIDAHSHLWLKQDTSWNGQVIRTTHNGRSLFLGEEVQMLPPFMIDGQNSAPPQYHHRERTFTRCASLRARHRRAGDGLTARDA